MGLREDIKKKFDKGKENLENLVEKTVKKAEEINETVKDNGGYLKVAKDGLNTAVEKAKELNQTVRDNGGYIKGAQNIFNSAITAIEGLYSGMKDQVFTDGKYDSAKVNALVKSGVDLSKEYGTKAGKTLVELSKDLSGKVVTTYDSLIPNADELKKYKEMGIGSDYNGILLKPNYEKCIDFVNNAKASILPTVENKEVILGDIKASASEDYNALLKYYTEKNIVDADRIKTVQVYLQ